MPKDKERILFRPWKELKALRDAKLRRFVTSYLYPFSPYYRRLFDAYGIKPDSIKTVSDLQRIPFTSKEDFIAPTKEEQTRKNIDFVLQPSEASIKKYLPKPELARMALKKIFRGGAHLKKSLLKEFSPIFLTATAGTTHQPISSLYTSYDIDNLKIYGRRIIEIFDIPTDGKALNIFPYAPHLAFWQTVFAGFSSNIFILSTGGGKTMGTEGNIQSLLKVKPQFLIGVPSYVYHVLKIARERNLSLNFLSKIALGASRVPLGFKRKIEKLLAEMGAPGVMVFGTYGFTEARAAWAECPTEIDVSSGYHTYPDKEIFEIIDPVSGEVKGEGADGEIVYTGIDARGTCVIRYRTGDLVKGGITYAPCPYCGRTVPRISSDIVRASNIKSIQLSKIKGALVNLNNLEHLLDDKAEIDEWQIEILKKNNDPFEVDEMVLYVSLFEIIDKDRFAAQLNEEVFNSADVSFNEIRFISRQEMHHRIEIESSVKAKKIVDRRPEG